MNDVIGLFPSPNEAEAARRQALAFHTEAVRSGLFAAALDIAKTMKEAGVAEGEACLVTGAIEFAVQLWDEVMTKAGNTPMESREALKRQMLFFLNKHRKARSGPVTEQ